MSRKRGAEDLQRSNEAFRAITAIGTATDVPKAVLKAREVATEKDADKAVVIDTFVRCVEGFPTRTSALALFLSLLGAKDPTLANSMAEALLARLRDAAAKGEWFAVKAAVRFIGQLGCRKALGGGSVEELFTPFLEALRDDTPHYALRKDTLAYVVLTTLPWAVHVLPKEGVDKICHALQTFVESRTLTQTLFVRRPVEVQQYNFVQEGQLQGLRRADDPDHIVLLWSELQSLREGGWETAHTIPQYETDPSIADEATEWVWQPGPLRLNLPAVSDTSVTYGDVPAALHLLYPWDSKKQCPVCSATSSERMDEGAEAEFDVPTEELEYFYNRESLPLGDRLVIREHIHDLIFTFSGSVKLLLGQLAAIPCREGAVYHPLVVETVLSNALMLPVPLFSVGYYSNILVELCRQPDSPFTMVVIESFEALYEQVPLLDPELADRLLWLFSFHISNFSFHWQWEDQQERSVDPRTGTCRRLFNFEAIQMVQRFAEKRKLARAIPKSLDRNGDLQGEEPEGHFKFKEVGVPFKREADLLLHRMKGEEFKPDDLSTFLELPQGEERAEAATPVNKLEIALNCMLFIGSGSISHERIVLTKFAGSLRDIIGGTAELGSVATATVHSFWKASTHRMTISLMHLLELDIITTADIVRWLFTPAVQDEMERAYMWEVVNQAFSRLAEATWATYTELSDLEVKLGEVDTLDFPQAAKDKARKQIKKKIARLEAQVRNKYHFDARSAFREFFGGVAKALKAHYAEERKMLSKLDEETSADQRRKITAKNFIWCRSVLGHANAVGRRYLPLMLPFLDVLHEEVFVRGKAPPQLLNIFYEWRLVRGARFRPLKGTFSSVCGLPHEIVKRIRTDGVEGPVTDPNIFDRLDENKVDLSSLLPAEGDEEEGKEDKEESVSSSGEEESEGDESDHPPAAEPPPSVPRIVDF